MSTGEDEPSSGLNGRLRPRKSNASPKTTPAIQKTETKPLNEKPKRTSTPSKVSPTKPDDFTNKTAVSPVSQVLCSFCDKTFGSRQAVAKHVKRVHSSTSKQDFSFQCLYCNHTESEPNDIIRHMIDSHPNQYFACLNCQSRFSSTSELAEHKLNVCEKQKPHYRNKLRQKSPKKTKSHKIDGRHEFRRDSKEFSENHGFNGIVISCELKPSHVHDEADIEDNIPTNLILPPSKSLTNAPVIEKNAVIVLDDLQWNKRIPSNFNFHNTDADQILSRLGVVHRGPRTGEPNRRDWLKIIDETNQKFERCFDTSFYSKVASNVQENLAKFLDGSCNFNPDPDNTIKTRKLKNSVAINTAEGFPILLAFEQFSRNVFDGYMPRSIAPKHKWKWDNLEHDKTLSPEQIKRDSHANNCIITLVSSLDIWTQLCMRQKFEEKFKTAPIEKKTEKQNIIGKELKEILEKRELPTPSTQVVKFVNPSVTKRDDLEFPASLGLAPATPNHDIKPAVLSGEWVRPRCYICCACGAQARDSRALSTHISTQHPNAQIQHYEIVGERLLNSDISKHLYVPPSQVNNRTRPLRGYRECTKCKKSISLEDLHQHMLDCAGDTPTVRRKVRARPFGVRKRRARLPDNTIRKKIRKDIRTRDRHRKTLLRPRQKNRTEVGDAETIRKMLADLPAKRHRVLVNPLNSNLRPRRKFDKQRNKLKMKKNITDDTNKKAQGSVQPNVGIERLNKKILIEADSRMAISNSNQVSNRQNSTPKRNSPLASTRNLRLRESKGSDQGSEGKQCADSGNKSNNTQSASGGSGNASFNNRENGNQSNNPNGLDNQQPGCSRQNDNNNDSPGQPPNVPLKHSIAQLTANSGTHDKSVQFHHLFLVQQECNNIPQHLPTRQKVLFENEAVVTKLDKPPLNYNHGGTMDPMAQKNKLNKPRKGLNDCIAMLKNKLVEPTSHEQVSIQCNLDGPSTSKTPAKNIRPSNQTNERSKVTHEIAIQCADLDSDEPLAQALMKERRASERQQALANIARLAAQIDPDKKTQSASLEPVSNQGETPKNDITNSITPNAHTHVKETPAQSNVKKSQNIDCTVETKKDNIEVHSTASNAQVHSTASNAQVKSTASNAPQLIPLLKPDNKFLQEQTNAEKGKEKIQSTDSDNNVLVSTNTICQNNENITHKNKKAKKLYFNGLFDISVTNILPQKKRKLKGDLEMFEKEKPTVTKEKPYVEKKDMTTKEIQKKGKGATKKMPTADSKKEKTHAQESKVSEIVETVRQTELKNDNPKSNKNKPDLVSILNKTVQNVTAEKTEDIRVQKAITITEVTKNEMKNHKKTQNSIPVTKTKNVIPGKQKCDDVNQSRHEKESKKSDFISQNINILEPEKILPETTKTDRFFNLTKEDGTKVFVSQESTECNQNLLSVSANISNSTTIIQPTLNQSNVQPKINTDSRKLNEEDTSAYTMKPMPQNLTMLDSCEDLSFKEQTEMCSNIPPAHSNIQMESMLPVPLDLSGKISSTQSDSPAPYPISTYEDTYETLDLSNKNHNRVTTFNRVFIEEDVVDLRVKYPTHMHYESDLSISSMPEEATDLSIGNEQLPKDLSLKSKSRSFSRNSALQDADYLNIDPNRNHYDSCTTSKGYNENTCLDFSIKENVQTNIPTDLSGKRENRIEPLVSISSQIDNRSSLESSNMHISATANISNTMNFSNSRMNSYSCYNKLPPEGISSHTERAYLNPTPLITSENISNESYEPAIDHLKHKTYIEPEVLNTPQELPKDYYLPMTNVASCLDMSKNNEQLMNTKENFISATKMPLCLSESVNTSITEYNLNNRVIVTSSKKYESTTPVYTHANACISISKVETNNSNSFTNTLMSIPGSTITNTTSVYTLAGTTTGASINYAECNPIAIDIEPQPEKNENDIMESSYHKIKKTKENITIEDKSVCNMDRKLENLDQDPDIAKKIALLPKELVEILGTMPVDHRKQLLNVLPQYVSNASRSTTQTSNVDQSYPLKSVTFKKAISPDLNNTVQSNLDVTENKRQHLLVPTTPPSTLPNPSSQLSPTSISSSVLLTPPTPNIGRQVINEQRDMKIVDCEPYKNINSNIIDLTEEDNSQSMPEAEVHTTTETFNLQPHISRSNDKQSVSPKSNTTKTNNDKTASLRAVRIKTQSERQRSAFPDLKIRKNSSEVPIISQQLEAKDMVDTKSLKIQQGEISSSQCINKNVECEISSSVSIHTEPEVKSDGYLKANAKKILQPNVIVDTFCDVGSKQIIDGGPGYKRYDVCSTILDKSNDSNDIKDNVKVSTISPPLQSDKIISNNNNVVIISKKDVDNLTRQVEDASSIQLIKSSEDDDSDDDVSLAVIVKQRNRDKLDIKSDSRQKESDIITNSNSVSSSVSCVEIKTDASVALKINAKIPEKSESFILRNPTYNNNEKDNSITEIKIKNKSRRARRNNNLNANKSEQQSTDSDFDINKENTKILDSENTKKHKVDDIKPIPIELDSGCVSSSNTEKDLISQEDHNHDSKIGQKRDITRINRSMDDVAQVNSSIVKSIDKNISELTTDNQTCIKSISHKSVQEIAKPDVKDLKNAISTEIVTKQIEIKSTSKENINITYVDPIQNEKFKLAEDSTTEALKQQQNTATPLRRSRRGKSLFIDSQVLLNTEESTLTVDTISEQKMPLTKKQLIFSKLLLDEEHNVVPPVSNDYEKLDNQVVINQSLSNTPNVEEDHVIQSYISDSDIEQQTDSSSKTNKRKKTVQIKKKNKKKKVQQEVSTLIKEKIEDDITPTMKKDVQLIVQKSIGKLQDDFELPEENLDSEKKILTTLDKEDHLLPKSKDLVDNTSNHTSIVAHDIDNKLSSVEKRKPDSIASDNESATSSLPKKSKINDINKDEIVPKKQDDIQSKKVVINVDSTITDNKVKTRTTCYNKPVAAKRPRSKSVFVNSSDYYDPYDIDLEEMNETPESLNRKVSRKPSSSKNRKTPATNITTKSDIKNKRLSEFCDAVPSTSKAVTDVEKTQNKEKENEDLTKTLTDTKETTCDSDDSSKSDVPLKKYVQEKERKMLDNIEKSNTSKQVDCNKDTCVTTNTKTKKKVKKSSAMSNKTEEMKIQNAENEAQLRSEQFMESFGFFSERKPRKSNLLATKKISETLHIIANETDDVYFGLKERSNKKISEKRHADDEKNKGNSKETKQDKKAAKRGRKKKNSTLIECSYCQLCKKEFRRPDNFLRHQMSVGHVTKISEIELKINVPPLEEEPNYLLAFKLQLDRVKMLHEKIAKRKKLSLPTYDIIIPNLEEILADAKRSVREKQIYNRGLSRDEALFIDCCELLKASHNKNVRKIEKVRQCNSLNCSQSSTNELDWFARSIDDKNDHNNDGDVDSITARNILESDEVRNLEKDLISGLQEAAKATKRNIATFNFDNLREIIPDGIIKLATCSLVNANYNKLDKEGQLDQPKVAPKRSPEYKEKMYPDINIESIDMFEDKFDKIKRKCRSQAAAASKQPQATPEANASYKVRKNKKKGKKKIRNHQNTVLTKAALKGFDGIKVSIVTTEINMSGIMTSARKSSKRKKKNQSKRKRERKSSEVSSKAYDNRQDEPAQKKLDIYEFMDTDDAEVFDFRPSTIMERFKSISNKEIPSTSKNIGKYDEADVSSDSASDGDDFVYMSDDYVCSDDETENSVVSCEIKNVIDQKKSPHKRKDATEKSAVMGKIFKHNALRSEKKISKSKDIEQPKANLDQLFDSLLEEQPQSSKAANETITSKSNENSSQRYLKTPSPKESNKSHNDDEYDINTPDYDDDNFYRDDAKDDDIDIQALKVDRKSTSFNKKRSITPTKRPSLYAIKPVEDQSTKSNKYKESLANLYPESAKKNISSPCDEFDTFSKRKEMVASPESVEESNSDNAMYDRHKSTEKSRDGKKTKSLRYHDREKRVSFDCNSESMDATNMSDDAGVARQRVRRKCTVGKQNVLAETWSSESEPDGMPPRPNSAESVVGPNRRRKGRKKEGHSGKKLKLVKRPEAETKVGKSESEVSRGFARPGPSLTAQAAVRSRRPAPYYWSEGEDEQEHVQQHGWIVGDSHKKLVTMLAHAKGRKRDDKRSMLE